MKDQNLFLDKLTFTHHLTDEQKNSLIDSFVLNKKYQNYCGKVYRNNKGRYNNNYQLNVFNGNTIEFSFYPINKNHNFIRVESNPEKLGKEGRVAYRELLIDILGLNVVKKIYFHANVTRIDVTLDIYDMEKNLYMYHEKCEHSSIKPDINGDIESQVVGSDKSNRRITMYNKNIEQGICSDKNYQRIEVRLRNLDCSMNELIYKVLDTFVKLRFYKETFSHDQRFSREFCNNAINDGINYALAKCDRNERLRILRYLEKHRVYPIEVNNYDFEDALKKSFTSLIHKKYQKQYMANVLMCNHK